MSWKENRKKWVDALRSGEYEQGRGFLCKEEKYCCLGVLCEVAGIQRQLVHVFTTINAGISVYEGRGPKLPPQAALDFVGLSSDIGMFLGGEGTLVEMNDDGVSFLTIADLIESEPEGLFRPLDEEQHFT